MGIIFRFFLRLLQIQELIQVEHGMAKVGQGLKPSRLGGCREQSQNRPAANSVEHSAHAPEPAFPRKSIDHASSRSVALLPKAI